jgi:hypothetical protein
MSACRPPQPPKGPTPTQHAQLVTPPQPPPASYQTNTARRHALPKFRIRARSEIQLRLAVANAVAGWFISGAFQRIGTVHADRT